MTTAATNSVPDDRRLNGSAPAVARGSAAPSVCLECGGPLPAAGEAIFCASTCRAAFNNRRAKRGAELYDLYMAHRFDRAAATDAKVISLMNRLASNYRRQDQDQRAGRRSWRPLRAVLADHPSLRAVVVWRGKSKGPQA